jgi:TRAP-type mannitol/chloroaromatic compound transport system permease small subunit
MKNWIKTYKVSIWTYVIWWILFLPSFIGAAARDEHTLGDNIFSNLLADLFYVLHFPAILIHKLNNDLYGYLFFVLPFISALIYAIVAQMVFNKIKLQSKN